MGFEHRLHLVDLGFATDEAGQPGPQIPGTRIQCPQCRKLGAQAGRPDLEHPHRGWQIPQPARSEIYQIDAADQNCRRIGQQDLAAVPCGHHARRAIECRTEVVPVAQLGFAGRQSHPHWQLECQLGGDRGINRGPRRGERGTDTVTGVLEQPAAARLDRVA
jgi:hypothetical protein